MSDIYWLTIARAEWTAAQIAERHDGRVVQVDREPPQGATIVGDLREDELPQGGTK